MKKLIALIVTVCVMLGMCTTAFAATTPEVAENGAITISDGAFTVDGTKVTLAEGEAIANNTQTTIVVVEGTAINTNSIQYINQGEATSFTFVPKDDAAYKAGNETVTLTAYIGGDEITKATAGTITYAADAGGEEGGEEGGENPEYTYDVALQNVTYNGTAATVVRMTGLDPAAAAVTVDGTVAKSYVRTTDSEDVIVACIAGTYTDADAVKALVSITEGTTEVILYGNANGKGGVDSEDSLYLARSVGNVTITGRGGSTTYSLPNDLSALHILDVNAKDGVNSEDSLYLARSVGNVTITGRGGSTTYSLDTMTCLTK